MDLDKIQTQPIEKAINMIVFRKSKIYFTGAPFQTDFVTSFPSESKWNKGTAFCTQFVYQIPRCILQQIQRQTLRSRVVITTTSLWDNGSSSSCTVGETVVVGCWEYERERERASSSDN